MKDDIDPVPDQHYPWEERQHQLRIKTSTTYPTRTSKINWSQIEGPALAEMKVD